MAAPLVKTKTPGIYKRGSRYVFSYRVNGKQRWESCRTLEDARRGKAARHTDIGRGEFEARSRVTLPEYLREWIERYQGRGRRGFRENTRDDYRRQLDQYALRYFPAKTRLTDVTPSAIAGFVAWLCDGREQAKNAHHLAVEEARAAGTREPEPLAADATRELADSTVRNIVAPVRAAFATAVREGLVRSNPTRDIDLPHRPTVEDDEEDVRALTREQLDTFLRVVPARWRTFFLLLAVTGLRISEAIGLEWRHVEFDGSAPHVKVRQRIVRGNLGPPKSKHGKRDVPIPHTLVIALRKQRAESEWPRDSDPVFPSAAGSVMSPRNLFGRVLKPAAEEAGVSWLGFHGFRHTCASMLIADGRNIVQVSRWLGHHSPGFTLSVYSHLMDEGVGEPLELAGSRIENPKAEPEGAPSASLLGREGANVVQTDPTPLDATAVVLPPVETAA